MTCDEAEILLHALLDDELDAGHIRDVETHVADCPRCAAALADYREMSKAFAGTEMRYAAPAALRERIEASLPRAVPQAVAQATTAQVVRCISTTRCPIRRPVIRRRRSL